MANHDPAPSPLPLDQLPFALLLREEPWVLAAVEAAHVLGIAVLVGTVIAFDLRVLGLARTLAVSALARLLLPLAVASLVLVIPSGVILFAAKASTLLVSLAFGVKMGLLFVQAGLAIAFHAGPYRGVAAWDTGTRAPRLARAIALASVLGWVSVLALGQSLAVLTPPLSAAPESSFGPVPEAAAPSR